MKHKSKKWMLQTKRADFRKISERFGISPVLARCIVNREVQEEEIGNYIQADWRQLHSPWLFKDMEKAVQILRGNREKLVAISSDFDCDGIFSAIILKKGLEKVGIRSEIYTPDRVAEGYGVNRRIVDEATEAGAEILLTCDNGIAANEEIRYAKEKGMTVIVTDHHEVQEELPPADAVVDHKQEDCGYPFKGLCGAGVAFQLIGALYEKEGISPDEREDLLEYAAIATVADVMELKGENRGLVKSGLRALEHTKNTGLRALLEVQELSGKELEAYHIGFILGPCFNAAGRIDTVTRAFELLEETNKEKALQMARQLKDINDTRKQMTEEAAKCAFEILQESGKEDEPVHIVLLPDCHESLAGLVAGRVRENYYRPVFVLTDSEDGVKGSGRSIESYSMYEELTGCGDLLTKFGGHPMAAGLSLDKENVEKFKRRLNDQCTLSEEELTEKVVIDMELPFAAITEHFIEELEYMEPFGKGNTKPVFAARGVVMQHVKIIGKNKNVAKATAIDAAGNRMEAICFHDAQEFAERCERNNGKMSITFYPGINEFRGERQIQIVITHYR